jgi:hypothetical protein
MDGQLLIHSFIFVVLMHLSSQFDGDLDLDLIFNSLDAEEMQASNDDDEPNDEPQGESIKTPLMKQREEMVSL